MISVNKIAQLKSEKDKEFAVLFSERVPGKRLSRLVEFLLNNEGLYRVRSSFPLHEGGDLEEAVLAYSTIVDILPHQSI